MCLSVTERGFGMTEFGQLLKSLRERRGVSQSKLAERAEFDHSYVSRLEGGARMPTRDAVDRLGDAMDLSEGERDMLLAAAGFLPLDFAKILSAEPVLGEVFYLLSDEQLPAGVQRRAHIVFAHKLNGSLRAHLPAGTGRFLYVARRRGRG